MTSTIRSALMSSLVALALLVASPAWAAPAEAAITGSNTSQSCFAGTDGSCSATPTADPSGAFSGAVTLDSLDSPLSRGIRYANSLSRYTIGFELDAPTHEVDITVTLNLNDASASWSQDFPEIFGGERKAGSGAKVLFQLLGHSADNCGCGWFIQSSPNVVAAQVTEPGEEDSVADTVVQVKMTARNVGGSDELLPAGHYEVLLRAYALADLNGAGDWGNLRAQMSGQIEDITVTSEQETTIVPSVLELSVTGNGANRVLDAVLTDDDGGRLADRVISFYGEGELIGTATTDEDGRARMLVDGKLRGSSREFRAEFAGDELYEAATATARS